MTEIESKKEKELKILGTLFGYLAIILGLLIPFLFEEMRKEDIKFKDELFYLMSIEIIFLLLIGICSFYFFRYSGKDQTAERIGLILLGAFFLVVIIILHPLTPSLMPSLTSAIESLDLNLLSMAVTTISVYIALIFIGSAYYVYALRRLISHKKAEPNKTKATK